MSIPPKDGVLSDDDEQQLELEQRQLDLDHGYRQRQLNLDRKKIELRKRRAKVKTPVDLTSDESPARVKVEVADKVNPVGLPEVVKNCLPSRAPTEVSVKVKEGSLAPVQKEAVGRERAQEEIGGQREDIGGFNDEQIEDSGLFVLRRP